jgi:hypothetical protein
MAELKNSKYIVTELKMPESKQKIHDWYSTFATRVLWMDDKVVEGAFHMNVAWYLAPAKNEPVAHSHDTGEIIGFFGNNPDDPYDLGGEVEIWLEDEKYVLDRSVLIYVPPGMVHCPLEVLRVERPIFHFTVVTGHQYEQL